MRVVLCFTLLLNVALSQQKWTLEPSLALTGDTRDFGYGYANTSIYLFGGQFQNIVQELRLSDSAPSWMKLDVSVPNGNSVFQEGVSVPYFPERHSFLLGCETPPTGSIFRFDILAKKFYPETTLPLPLYACRMIEWGGQLLVLGGYTSSTTDTVQIYNLDSKSWSNGSALSMNIEYFGLARFPPTVKHPGALFLFGGWTGPHVYTKAIEGYMNETWKTLDVPLNVEVSSCPAVTLPKNMAYIIGGFSNEQGATNTQIFHWDGATKETLTDGPALNNPRFAGGAVYSAFDKKIYALGGSTSTVESLSVASLLQSPGEKNVN